MPYTTKSYSLPLIFIRSKFVKAINILFNEHYYFYCRISLCEQDEFNGHLGLSTFILLLPNSVGALNERLRYCLVVKKCYKWSKGVRHHCYTTSLIDLQFYILWFLSIFFFDLSGLLSIGSFDRFLVKLVRFKLFLH